MKKKLLAILTSVLLLCTMLPLGAIPVFAATSGTTGDCTWTLDGTHLTISGNGKMGDYDTKYSGECYQTTAPWGWNITSVTIENSVTTVGDSAFCGCTSLTSITIPDSVTTIGDKTFFGCTALTSVTIPDSVTTIGDIAFCCTSLTSVAIPNSVTSIGSETFFDCASLTSVTIPDSVTSIGGSAFKCCTSLTSITIPDSVTTIGDQTFFGCTALTSATIGDGVTAIGNDTFLGCISLTSVTIPNSVTTIGHQAFFHCSSIISVSIGDGVTTTGVGVFYGCSSLTSVTIGDSVTSIGEYVFYGCTSLTDVYYTGSESDRANITIGTSNDPLLNATWHYNCINPKDHYSPTVSHSVMDTENGHGLAFRFEVAAAGVSVSRGTVADFSNATINYLGNDCKLIGMGAVVTNDTVFGNNNDIVNLDNVNGKNIIHIPVVYLQEVTDTSCAFAIRLINIPENAIHCTVWVHPYFIVEVDGEEIVVYGNVDYASCAEYM